MNFIFYLKLKKMNASNIFENGINNDLTSGVNEISNAVAVTMGGKGRNVIIDRGTDAPQITKDGVTVARAFEPSGGLSSLAIKVVQRVAKKTNDEVGDGTTATVVLLQSVYNKSLVFINDGKNPVWIKRALDKATRSIVEILKGKSTPVGDVDDLGYVANIASNGDKVISTMITDTVALVGKEGVISIQAGNSTGDIVEVSEGMSFNKGYISPYLVTNKENQSIEMDNPFVLICNKKISLPSELFPIMELGVKTSRPILIIADEIDAEALQVLIINKLSGVIQIAAVKSPGYGASRVDAMDDLAVLTGTHVVNAMSAVTVATSTEETLGSCQKVIINLENTTIIGGKGDQDRIVEQIRLIKAQRANIKEDYDKQRYDERLARLAGKIAVIYVGGDSEVEMLERKDRFEDSLNAVRAAIEGGYLPGGGTALLSVSIEAFNNEGRGDEYDDLAYNILSDALKEPFRRIVGNATANVACSLEIEGEVISRLRQGELSAGYNVATDQYGDMLKSGIIDPTKVVCTSLINAVSAAGMLLTSGAALVNLPETKIEPKTD